MKNSKTPFETMISLVNDAVKSQNKEIVESGQLKVGQVYKDVSPSGYEWNNTFINIDKQYKNGNFRIIVATAAIGQNTRSISPSELLYKIKKYNWTLIFDGEKIIK
jgi:hypothetical protein